MNCDRFSNILKVAFKFMSDKVIKLNLGCGGRPLPGYINIDQDNIAALKKRYPSQNFDGMEVFQYDIFNLPYDDSSVDEVRADAFVEHLSFIEEPKLFYEVTRVLKKGGKFTFSVPNFEEVVKLWLAAKDEWKAFYRDDDAAIKQQHWFGQYSYAMDNRWGYLCAIIYGSQNGEGQYHKNCYTIPKIKAMMKHLGFNDVQITESRWKGERDPMIDVVAIK